MNKLFQIITTLNTFPSIWNTETFYSDDIESTQFLVDSLIASGEFKNITVKRFNLISKEVHKDSL